MEELRGDQNRGCLDSSDLPEIKISVQLRYWEKYMDFYFTSFKILFMDVRYFANGFFKFGNCLPK